MSAYAIHIEPTPRLDHPSSAAGTDSLATALEAYWLSGTETNLPTEWDESLNFVLQLTDTGGVVEGAGGTGKFVDKAAIFDESSRLSRADAEALTPVEEMSFAVWVYFSPTAPNTSATRTVFSKRTVGYQPQFELRLDTNGIGTFAAAFEVTIGTTNRYVVSGTVPQNQWVLIVCYVSAAGVGIVIDGTATESASSSVVTLPPTGSAFVVGSRDAGVGTDIDFKGRMQHLCRWNRLLTTDEMAALLSSSPAEIIASEGTTSGITDSEGTLTDAEGTITDGES